MSYVNNSRSYKGQKPWSPVKSQSKPSASSAPVKPYTKEFMPSLERTINSAYNYRLTENGALGYASTGKNLLDMNFKVSSYRGKTELEIYSDFRKAFNENPLLALRWLFFVRDIRGGLGERRLFRVILSDLADCGQSAIVNAVLPLIPEYGRWDDLLPLLNKKSVSASVLSLLKSQLRADIANMKAGKNVSLLAKWLPSENASSESTKKYAAIVRNYLRWTPREYRKTLSALRNYIDVIERKMSSSRWSEIDYETVPSQANLKYNAAFIRNDYTRRMAYLDALAQGEANINSSTLYPHDILHRYCNERVYVTNYDSALEKMWESLPDYVQGNGNTLVVADGSGSMTAPIPGSNIRALEVANALAIYFAERCSGEFNNCYITFSSRPQLVRFGQNNTLAQKINEARKHSECTNTNIEATFNLILQTAIDCHMSQADLPKNVLIISDMEFDCGTTNKYYSDYATLFEEIRRRFMEYGYTMPRLVFWNVCSRSGAIPMTKNDAGVALVSGFSPSVCKMVLSGELDPYKCLVETLMDHRYDAVEQAVNLAFK